MLRSLCMKMSLIAFAMVSTAHAQQVFWKKQNVEINVNSLNAASAVSTFTGIFQKVLVTPVARECGYYAEPVTRVVQGTCYDVSCSGGSGRSPNWDAFYGAKKAEKASKLASAIRGIGKPTADALVDGGFFSSKPRSWDAFKAEIKSAESRGVINEQVKSLVLSTYREDNMANLGYSSGSCQKTPYACNEVIVESDGGYVSKTCVDMHEQVIDAKPMSYTFNVQNVVVLPSETEAITVSLSGDPSESSVASAYYNNYIHQTVPGSAFNHAVMNIQGVSRKQVALPTSGLQSVTLLPVDKTKASLQITVAPSILPATANETLMVQFEVRTCQVGFLGACGFGWDRVQKFNSKLTHTVSTFNAPITLQPGRNGVRMEVLVQVYKQNSVYHNASPISRTTNKLTIK